MANSSFPAEVMGWKGSGKVRATGPLRILTHFPLLRSGPHTEKQKCLFIPCFLSTSQDSARNRCSLAAGPHRDAGLQPHPHLQAASQPDHSVWKRMMCTPVMLGRVRMRGGMHRPAPVASRGCFVSPPLL